MLFAGLAVAGQAHVPALGPVPPPAMARQGDSRRFAAAITAATDVIGPIIPTSGSATLRADAALDPIADLFPAGIAPKVTADIKPTGAIARAAARRDPPAAAARRLARAAGRASGAFFPLPTPVLLHGGVTGGAFTRARRPRPAIRSAAASRSRAPRLGDIAGNPVRAGPTPAVALVRVGPAMAFGTVTAPARTPELPAGLIPSPSDKPPLPPFPIHLLPRAAGAFPDAGPAIVIPGPVYAGPGARPVPVAAILAVTLTIGPAAPRMGTVPFVAAAVSGLGLDEVVRSVLPMPNVHITTILRITCFPGALSADSPSRGRPRPTPDARRPTARTRPMPRSMLVPLAAAAPAAASAVAAAEEEVTPRATAVPNSGDADHGGPFVLGDHVETASHGRIATEPTIRTRRGATGKGRPQGATRGSTDIVGLAPGGAAGLVPLLPPRDPPRMTSEDRAAEAALTGGFARTLRPMALEEPGGTVRLVAFGSTGGRRDVASTGRRVWTPAGLSGPKRRGEPAHLPPRLVSAPGAAPTPVPRPERFPASGTGVAGGAGNGLPDLTDARPPGAVLRSVTLDGQGHAAAFRWPGKARLLTPPEDPRRIAANGFAARAQATQNARDHSAADVASPRARRRPSAEACPAGPMARFATRAQATLAGPRRGAIRASGAFAAAGGDHAAPSPEGKTRLVAAAAPARVGFVARVARGPAACAALAAVPAEARAAADADPAAGLT
jgi:TRAP-type C4-dicarboxylate transport system permease large subunit